HSSMIINWWLGVKYVPGGQAFFIGIVNSFVHVFMYTYYGLSVLGPAVQKYLWWKSYLTILQLVKFVAIALHTSYNLFTDCDFSDGFNTVVFFYIVTLIILFLNLHVQTYRRDKAKSP
ncbi:very long chain fatty acid elongase 4-like, partial [Lampetra fluviatilis]